MNYLPMFMMVLLINFFAVPPVSGAAGQNFTLFYSNNVQGEIDPCG